MSDDRPLKRIKTDAETQLSPDQDARVEVVVQSMSGAELAKLQFDRACPVSEVKGTLEAHFGYPWKSQQLVSRDTVVQDDTLLSTLHRPVAFTLVLADFNKGDALEGAVCHGHEAAVRWLLERSLRDEDRRAILLGSGHLRLAARGGHEGVCRALLGAAPSADVQGLMLEEVGGVRGETALMAVVRNGHMAICRLLLNAAPSPDMLSRMLHATNTREDTALHGAARRGHELACRLLLESSPDAGIRRKMLLRPTGFQGFNALHIAAMCGRGMICRALLEAVPSPQARGEVLDAKSSLSCTALDLAVHHGHERVAQLLRDAVL